MPDIPTSLAKAQRAFESILSLKKLPSALDIYNASCLLYDLQSLDETILGESTIKTLHTSFILALTEIDDSHLKSVVLNDIHRAFGKIVQDLVHTTDTLNMEKCSQGLKAIWILYAYEPRSEETKHLCRLGFSNELCLSLRRFYDVCVSSETDVIMNQQRALAVLASIITNGLIDPLSSRKGNEDESIFEVMETVQLLSSDGSFCLGDLIQFQLKNTHMTTLAQALDFRFTKEVQTQKDYIKSILNSAPSSLHSDSTDLQRQDDTGTDHKTDSKFPTVKSKLTGLQRLVSQIKPLFPQFGDGYLEVALACYNNDVDRTTSALFEAEEDPSSLHPRLQVLDKKLPARKRNLKTEYEAPGTSSNQDDVEAKEIQKARLKQMEKEEENQAYLLSVAMNEYNDEYDDQYDGIGDDGGATGGIGGADAGLYDVDYNAIKAYNRVVKDLEADKTFWEESRNLNERKSKSANKPNKPRDSAGETGNESEDADSEDDNSKKYRGLDKGKGGRIIGPDGKFLPFPKKRQAGGKNHNKVTSSSDNKTETESKGGNELTKIQKLRKTNNKAKIGNHHRKDRALKKTAM
jgi:hypothetical protein